MNNMMKQRSASQIDVWGRPWYWRAEHSMFAVYCDARLIADYETQAKAEARIKLEVEKPYADGVQS